MHTDNKNKMHENYKKGTMSSTITIKIDGKEALQFSPLSLIAQAALQSDIHFMPIPGSVLTCTLSNGKESLTISELVPESN